MVAKRGMGMGLESYKRSQTGAEATHENKGCIAGQCVSATMNTWSHWVRLVIGGTLAAYPS